MVGALKAAGEGQVSAHDVQIMLESQDSAHCPIVAPPDGLVFMKVE